MINLSFWIKLPTKNRFSSIYCKCKQISKNKSWEFQVMKGDRLLGIDLSTDWAGYDHAGPSIQLMFLGYEVAFKIYDHRHWDYEKVQWE